LKVLFYVKFSTKTNLSILIIWRSTDWNHIY